MQNNSYVEKQEHVNVNVSMYLTVPLNSFCTVQVMVDFGAVVS